MMSFKEFKATVSTARVAGPQKEINTITTKPTFKNHSDSSKEHTNFLTSTSNTASPSTSSSSSSLPSASSTTMLQDEQHVKMCKLFTFIEDTYRDIRRFNSGLYKDSYSTQLLQSINKYKNGCNEIFGKVLESYDMSSMLSQNIVRTIDIFKELGTCLTDMEEYQYRICEIMSIFIVCELRLSVDVNPQEQLSIAHRIIYIMRRHLVQEEEQGTLYNILRTLVYIPKLYNARDIMCAIFGEFIPIKPVPEVNVLPDKLYMLYIIVFYRWMMMQKDDDDKLLIVNFAESFMKPSVSLCSNNLYGAYLPMYTTHSTATRTILNNLKFYRDIRNASIIDNALKTIGSVVNLCDDDEDEDVIVIDSSPATDFAQIFASALLEPLNGSLTNIKLEEKTVVGLVDLTMEEEPTNSQNSIVERHDKWLNEFQQLAKQYREAQLLLEKQQNNQLNASREKETVICLDSDSEDEAEEVISAAASKEKPETAAAAAADEAATQNKPCEDLFIDNYPLTNTPIHCDTDLESLDALDDNDDATKISSRFFTGTLRTYQAKKSNLSETEDKNHSDADESNNRSLSMNNAYRRDSIHISSSPPDVVENEEDEGTDVQDEHDDGLLDEEEEEEEANAYTFLPTTSKQTESAIRPMGPYPTYNNMHNNSNNHNDKHVLSQSLSRYQPDKQYYSDSSEVKAHSKQKKRVQFNTSPLGPTASSSANVKMPLKPALQQQKYKAADAPEYFHLRGFERFPGGPSVASSTSTSTSSSIKHQEQQEPTNQECIKKREIIKPTINNIKDHNNKCSNLYKNLSVFNQKSLNMNFKQKSLRNVKINLKKLKLDNDISLTNLKSNKFSKEHPHTTTSKTLTIINDNNNSNTNTKSTTYKRTESCQLNTNPIATTSNQQDDDIIFKKPLPVTKKVFKSSKPLKIHKVVSLRKQPYYVKPKVTINSQPDAKKETIIKQIKVLKNEPPVVEQANNLNLELPIPEKDTEMDDLSKISKLLTDEINNLTCEIKDTKDLQVNKELPKENIIKEKAIDAQNLTAQNNDIEPLVLQNEMVVEEKESSSLTMNYQESNEELINESNENLTILSNDNLPKENVTQPQILKEDVVAVKQSISQKERESLLAESEELKETSLHIKEEIENSFNNSKQEEEIVKELSEENKNEMEIAINENEDSVNKPTNTKDGNLMEQTEETQATSEQNFTTEMQTGTLESDNNTEEQSPETIQNCDKLVTNFCAEFLAGLPNETSTHALNEVGGGSKCEAKNDNDFDFENPRYTPYRIDLDVMAENTSDVPSTLQLTQMLTEECEADKLLDDFNHKTENIVGYVLNKKTLHTDETIASDSLNSLANDDKKDTDIGKESSKRLREPEYFMDTEEEEFRVNVTKKAKTQTCDNENNELEQNQQIPEESNMVKTFDEHKLNEAKEAITNIVHIVADHVENKVSSITPNTVNNMEETPKSLKKLKTTLTNSEISHLEIKEQTQEKKLKKINKPSKSQERIATLPRENTEEEIKEISQSEESTLNVNDSNKIDNNFELAKEHSCKAETIPQQMDASIDENQHMTLELGNWNKELENETKTSDSETGGVSAIFSFPKIPIISISICTTPNNKTYFKISNRENDKQIKEAVGKSKKAKSCQQDSETETKNEEKHVSTSVEFPEIVKNSDSIMQHDPVEDLNVEDEEEAELDEDEEEPEVECDMEIEKFSQDSNSACSLPLKKRPTQAEQNPDETEDSQHVLVASYEQPQEIAAEVVIEDKPLKEDICSLQMPQEIEVLQLQQEINKNVEPENQLSAGTLTLIPEVDDNKPSTSAASLKKLSDPSSPFKRRVHIPIRPIGQPPIQIVAPQLKDNTPSPIQDNRPIEIQVPSVQRIQTQNTQPLPESYPATPMLSVANVEKLMDLNRFIEDLLASPDVMTIIDNANACGYYAEGQAYEMERIAILEHYNIANAKGNTSVTKPLYWKKSAGDTISIFNDNDNEWIALPPSTAKQLLKLSFVLSILQQQYKVSDVRQRINIALTFLIQTSYTSKFKNNTNAANSLQQRMQIYSRNISDATNSAHSMLQPLPSTSYFRIATNNEALNTNFNMNSNMESVQDIHPTNYSNSQQQAEMAITHEPAAGINHNWNNLMQLASPATGQVIEQPNTTNSPQRQTSNNGESEQPQAQNQVPDKRNPSWEELNNDQLYINPPCATSPQNEVIVNTNGVELHELPQNFQDQQNIFISITDESGPETGSLHKYNTRQQQQQQQQHQHLRNLEDSEPSTSQQQLYTKRPCLGNNNVNNVLQNHFARNNIISTFGNQEINLQNPYRMQQNQQHQQPLTLTNQNLNTSPKTNFPQRNISPQNITHNLPINIYNNNSINRPNPKPLSQQQHRMTTRYTSSFNTQSPASPPRNASTAQESNYKDILQPYITYLIKDHEKTSKHLLQVFEEVSQSNPSSTEQNSSNNFTQPQQQLQQFHSLLPPLIRNPQQNHMPGLHQIPGSSDSILPSLIRNPHQSTLPNRDSGALQVVQSFIEQSQTTFDNVQQLPSTISNPGFAKEYVNFVDSRDEILQKEKVRLLNKEQQQLNENHVAQQRKESHQRQLYQPKQQRQESQRLNSVKRKCQERNDKLAEDLKRKIMEFSQLKHNVQVKLIEKQKDELKQMEITTTTPTTLKAKRRGRPKKNVNNLIAADSTVTVASLTTSDSSCEANSTSPSSSTKRQKQTSARVTRRKQVNSDLTTIDHAYFRQRTAAREACKRINATINNSFQ